MLKVTILFALTFAVCYSIPVEKQNEMQKKSLGQMGDLRVNADLFNNERKLFGEENHLSVDSAIVKLCQSSSQFKYYQAYPNDSSKYIECDPWGNPIVKSCEVGQIWNSWTLKCELNNLVQNITDQWSWINQLQTSSQAQCVYDSNMCQNSGVCKLVLNEYKCVCKSEFTGDFCEIKIESNNVYSEIISGKFSLESFKRKLIAENLASDLSSFEKFNQQLDNSTFNGLKKYLSFYKSGELRYDIVVNSLVEEVLENIFPDAYYLSWFNASSETVDDIVRTIPNLLAYAKFSNERYAQVFIQYSKVLKQLSGLLKSNWPTLQKESAEYLQFASLYQNRSLSSMNVSLFSKELDNQTPIEIQYSEEELKQKMKVEYNQTLEYTNELVKLLSEFKKNALIEIAVKPEVKSELLVNAKFDGAKEAIRLFDDISKSSDMIWNSLVNFGFWFLTNNFAQVHNAHQ